MCTCACVFRCITYTTVMGTLKTILTSLTLVSCFQLMHVHACSYRMCSTTSLYGICNHGYDSSHDMENTCPCIYVHACVYMVHTIPNNNSTLYYILWYTFNVQCAHLSSVSVKASLHTTLTCSIATDASSHAADQLVSISSCNYM